MTATTRDRVVLAVSEATNYEGALQFAVHEALRWRCGITVIHTLPDSVAPPPDVLLTIGRDPGGVPHHFVDRSQSLRAHEFVHDVAHRARSMGGKAFDVNTQVPVGRPHQAIVEAAYAARLIVLQHRNFSHLKRMLTPSTSVGVATRSHCPTVIVPSPWHVRSSRNRITVGIADIGNSAQLLEVAFKNAEARLAGIDVVHSWKYLSATFETATYRAVTEEVRLDYTRQLDQALELWRHDFPSVTVEQYIVRGNAAEALIGHSKNSDLLIVGRRDTAGPLPLPLGMVARKVVNNSHCPVEVVPYRTTNRRSQRSHLDRSTSND